MAITYPLTLPSNSIKDTLFHPRAAVSNSRSPFTFQNQVQVHPGKIWAVDVSLKPMRRADAEEWVAILLSLNGREGTFLLGDVANKAPRGSALGTPVVNGASQTGQVLSTSGWTASATGVLLRGDWIQLGGTGSPALPLRLYKVVNDVDADGGGLANIDIWPSLRESPANGESLILNNTVGTFSLDRNEMPWSINEALIYGIDFVAVEDLRT